MGLYDTITCKYPLPKPEDLKGYKGSVSFQTKDLGEGLSHFEIREDGSLWVEKAETEYISRDSKTLKDDVDERLKKLPDNTKLGFSELSGLKVLKSWWEFVEVTTTVEMYDYCISDDTHYDYDITYKLKIIDGIVKELNLHEFKANPNRDRKLRDIKFKREAIARNIFVNKWYYKYILKYYNRLIFFIARSIKKICDKIGSSIWTIERNITF